MVCDGLGPVRDFETFAFDGRWNRLTRFRVGPSTMGDSPSSRLAIDNLTLRRVAEPASVALVDAAMLGLLSASSQAPDAVRIRVLACVVLSGGNKALRRRRQRTDVAGHCAAVPHHPRSPR